MKTMKKIAALLLALVMVLSMTITASAAETGSITIQGATSGKVYEIYRIFDLTRSGSTAVAYTINSRWAAFFAEGGEGAAYIVNSNTGSLNPITVDGQDKYINITSENIGEFSRKAQAYAATLDPDQSATAAGEELVFSALALGYYLVWPQGAVDILEGNSSICSLTSTVPDATVEVKATYPTIEKTDDAVSADLGQVVNYTVTGLVPDTTGYKTYEYTVRDTMSDGLTFRKDVKVTFGGTTIEVTPDYDAITNGFVLTFDMTGYQTFAGEEITITYSAVVNEKAVVKDKVEKNKAVLIYSNNPDDAEDKITNPPIEEEVYTSQIVIDKVDGTDSSVKLAGAEFVLRNDKNAYYNLTDGVVTWGPKEQATKAITDENGSAGFPGLKNGTYYMEEVKAPDGYNLLTKPVTVEVNSNDASAVSVSVVSQVQNNSGTTLPSTGGMGTTLFYCLGGILVAAACVMLIAKKRMGTL